MNFDERLILELQKKIKEGILKLDQTPVETTEYKVLLDNLMNSVSAMQHLTHDSNPNDNKDDIEPEDFIGETFEERES